MAEGGREASGEIRQMKDRGMSNTVEVSGFSTNTSQELLENYFENSRRSGGGDMEEIHIRDGVAYITFKDAEVAQRVVSCNNHQVDGRTLTVTLLHTSPPRSYYTNRVLIQGLNSAVTEDLLRNFLEAVTESEVREFLYGEEEGNVVVTLPDNIDIGQLRKTFQERRIEGAVLKVERVAISRCILVQNIQTSMSHDVVLFYFDNKRKSGGGNVERVEMKADEGYCLVYFEDHSVVDRVLSQSHKVDGVDLEVHHHYECLGQRSSRNKSDPYLRISNPVNKGSSTLEEENTDNQSDDEDSSSVSSNPDKESDFVEVQERQESEDEDSSSVSSNPDKESDFLEVKKMQESEDLMKFRVILDWNHVISAPQGEEAVKWRFLFDCPYTQKEICEDPIMLGTSLEYRKGTSPLIRWKKSDRTVKEGVEELLQKHAKQVQICSTVIPNEAVKFFLEAQELVELFQNKMVIAYKSETNLYICGKKEHMGEAVRHVNNTKDYTLGLISKTEKISLKDIPLQLIKRWMEVHMSPDTSDIHYEFREDQKSLHITGLESEIIKVKDNLLNLFENITRMTYKSRLCVAHFSVFEQSGVVKYIEGILQEQKLVCTWETNKAGRIIVVTAFDKETCEMSCEVIDAACVTEDISLQLDAVTKIIPSDSWEQELSSLCTRFEGKMKMWLDLEKNILEYIYTPDVKEMVRHEVQGLINSWDREKHLLIEKQVAEKLENEQQKLRNLEERYSVIISVSRKTEKIGFLIVGKDINIQPALEELGKECNVILEAQSKPATLWPSLENCECICVPETNEAELIMLKDKCLLKSNKNNQAELKDTEMDTEIAEITPVFSLKVSRPGMNGLLFIITNL